MAKFTGLYYGVYYVTPRVVKDIGRHDCKISVYGLWSKVEICSSWIKVAVTVQTIL